MRRVGKSQRGQGMTEYIIIVALVAILSIFVVTVFGDNIRALFGNSANALTGSDERIEGQTVDQDQVKKDLKSLNEAP